MFQYTKEVIINSTQVRANADAAGSMIDRVVAKNGLLNILRSGEYKFEGIVDRKIHKTPGIVGSAGNVAITCLPLAEVGIYRLAIYIGMNNKFYADMAYANWYKFGKPVIVEFEITASNNTAEGIALLIAESVKEAVPYNNTFIRPLVAADVVTLNLADPYAHIKGVTLDFYDSTIKDYAPAVIKTEITDNVEPFGTGAWVQENLRFPSIQNLRYNALYKDEYPLPGVLYTEYSFLYERKRDIGGVSVVGQANTTVTRHVYYVAESAVADFEAKITTAFGDNVIVEPFSTWILSAPTVANDGVPVQLVATVYPDDSLVTMTYTGKGLPAGVTLTEDGILTAATGAVVGKVFQITATPSLKTYAAKTRDFTVIAG